jgi:hypothetical protein
MTKSFDVVGNRVWRKSLGAVYATSREPFAAMPISYDNAFGGIDNSHADPKYHDAFRENPVGVGFHANTAADAIEGKPLPNTQERGQNVSDHRGPYRPMALGALGRGWSPRLKFAGTYDDAWLADGFPFLPADFDERYFQAAPPEQQIDYLQGGEDVELVNLTPVGRAQFRMPPTDLPIEFLLKDYQSVGAQAVVDTILIEPDLSRFSLIWRTSIPLRKNVFEVPACIVGTMSRGWYRAREVCKSYYSSLARVIADRI